MNKSPSIQNSVEKCTSLPNKIPSLKGTVRNLILDRPNCSIQILQPKHRVCAEGLESTFKIEKRL